MRGALDPGFRTARCLPTSLPRQVRLCRLTTCSHKPEAHFCGRHPVVRQPAKHFLGRRGVAVSSDSGQDPKVKLYPRIYTCTQCTSLFPKSPSRQYQKVSWCRSFPLPDDLCDTETRCGTATSDKSRFLGRTECFDCNSQVVEV